MPQPIDQLTLILKQNGQSLTKPRRIVFEAMQNKEPQSMAQIVASCSQIDRASVYRTIGLFERIGVVQRLQIGWKYKLELSQSFHYHHHHLTCVSCGQIIPFEEPANLVHQLVSLSNKNNFAMSTHHLEIQGLCSKCRH